MIYKKYSAQCSKLNYYLFLARSGVQKQSGSTVITDGTGINNEDDILSGMNNNFDVYHI